MGAASGINIGSVSGDFSLQAGGDIVAGNKTVINNIIQRLAKELTTTPYKFLAAYDVADRDIFYGRVAVVDELAGAATRHKVIIINGASGAGKSSLVNAGLIPRLADNGYSYVGFREYSNPLEQLTHLGKLLAASPLPRTEIGSDNAAALPRQVADAISSSENLETGATKELDLKGPRLLLQLIRAVRATPIAVVLDQFERFFVNVPPDKRSAFIGAVKHCLQYRSAHEIIFVIALRHEFYGQLLLEFEAQIPEFSSEAYRFNLLPLTQSGIARSYRQAARKHQPQDPVRRRLRGQRPPRRSGRTGGREHPQHQMPERTGVIVGGILFFLLSGQVFAGQVFAAHASGAREYMGNCANPKRLPGLVIRC
jgi:hypothetical protein